MFTATYFTEADLAAWEREGDGYCPAASGAVLMLADRAAVRRFLRGLPGAKPARLVWRWRGERHAPARWTPFGYARQGRASIYARDRGDGLPARLVLIRTGGLW